MSLTVQEHPAKEDSMSRSCSFTALPDAVVGIASMTDLKTYLLRKFPSFRGLKVITYSAVGSIVRAKVQYPDGSNDWLYYGKLEDIARNIQLGSYEKEGPL